MTDPTDRRASALRGFERVCRNIHRRMLYVLTKDYEGVEFYWDEPKKLTRPGNDGIPRTPGGKIRRK